MPTFAVSEEKNKWLKEKMESLNIREEDIRQETVKNEAVSQIGNTPH